jgi:hypothetical protein
MMATPALTAATRRRGPVRSAGLVRLRSTMPVELVTLQHDVPKHVKTTPKSMPQVATAVTEPGTPGAGPSVDETVAREGGDAR